MMPTKMAPGDGQHTTCPQPHKQLLAGWIMGGTTTGSSSNGEWWGGRMMMTMMTHANANANDT